MASRTVHGVNAEKVIAALKAVEKMIPYLRSRNRADEKFVRGLMTVPIPFMQTAAVIASQSPDLPAMRRLTPDRAHDVLEYLNAYLAVRNQLAFLLDKVSFSMQALQADLASDSLLVYALSKTLARDRTTSTIMFREQVKNLRRLLGRRGPKKAKVKQAAAGAETAAPPEPAKRAKATRKRRARRKTR